MYRAIIVPKEKKLTIELPDQLVGKEVEILAFEIDKDQPLSGKPSIDEIRAFYRTYQVDMTGFTFSRAEANERWFLY